MLILSAVLKQDAMFDEKKRVEGGKGSGKEMGGRAHHSRLNQRAKEMAREGFPGMRELNKNSISDYHLSSVPYKI